MRTYHERWFIYAVVRIRVPLHARVWSPKLLLVLSWDINRRRFPSCSPRHRHSRACWLILLKSSSVTCCICNDLGPSENHLAEREPLTIPKSACYLASVVVGVSLATWNLQQNEQLLKYLSSLIGCRLARGGFKVGSEPALAPFCPSPVVLDSKQNL